MTRRGGGKRGTNFAIRNWLNHNYQPSDSDIKAVRNWAEANSLRLQGKDNPFVLDVMYDYSVEQSDGSGVYVGATPAAFRVDRVPGFEHFKYLFREFRVLNFGVSLISPKGSDADGVLAIRVTYDKDGSQEATFDLELEKGAQLVTMDQLSEEWNYIPMTPEGPIQLDWHELDLTDSNNYGYDKEFGQIFIRGQDFPASTNIFHFRHHARIVLRGYQG